MSMERTTFGLLFYIRRTKLNKSGEASIFCVLRSMVSVQMLRSNVPSNPVYGIQPKVKLLKTGVDVKT